MFSLSFALCLMAILFMAELQGWTAHRVAAPWDKLVHASVYGLLSGLLGWGMVTYHRFWWEGTDSQEVGLEAAIL